MFSGAFAKLRKTTDNFVRSVSLSLCPHEITRFKLDGFSWNLIFVYLPKICRDNSGIIKIGQEYRTPYKETNIYFWSRLIQFFLEWEIIKTEVVEKTKTQFTLGIFFFRKSCRLWVNVENYYTARQATGYERIICLLYAG